MLAQPTTIHIWLLHQSNVHRTFQGYLQGQVGNPEGEDKPNKKYYDPRIWIRAAEESMLKRAQESLTVLGEYVELLL